MFVSALLTEGKPAVRNAIERGVDTAKVFGDAQRVYEFILTYLGSYKDVPTRELVLGHTSVDVPVVEGKAGFFTDAVLNRALVAQLGPKMQNWVGLIEQYKGDELVTDLDVTLRKIRQDHKRSRVEPVTGGLLQEVWQEYLLIRDGKRGIEFPWPTLTDYTRGLWPEDLILFVARVGIGKCASFDSLVYDTETGLPHTIQSICEQTASVTATATWSKPRGMHAAPITAKLNSGTRSCLRVRLHSGREVRVTPEHPLLTPAGWARADAVRVGSTLALPARMPHPTAPVPLPDASVDLLALLLTDGGCTTSTPTYTKDDETLVALARAAAEAHGATLVKYTAPYQYGFRGAGRHGDDNPIARFAQVHGVLGKKSPEKTLPEAVYRLPPEQLGRFLSVFWMSDGYITDNGLELILSSREMVAQLQSLLLRFGVQSRMVYKRATYQGGVKDAWRLRVLAESYEAFRAEIGLWGAKGVQLDALCAKDRNPNVGSPRVSAALKARLQALSATGAGRWKGGLHEKVAARLGWKTFLTRNLFGRHDAVQLTPFKAFCEEYGCTEEFRWWWDSELFWDEVVAVESIGALPTYDLSMPPTECFVANDVVIHNSWSGIMISRAAWQAGKKVLFITTEMSRIAVARRFIAIHLRLPYRDFTRGRLGSLVEQKVAEEILGLAEKGGFSIVGGDFNFTFDGLEAAIDEAEPDLLVVDGAYLMKAEGASRTERAAAAFDELKRIAKRNRIPVVATSQFNREVKSNAADTIQIEKIALTDAASWNADGVVALIQTEDMRRDKRVDMKILKNREGVLGDPIQLWWNFDTMDFSEVPQSGGGDADEFGSGLDPNAPPGGGPVDDAFAFGANAPLPPGGGAGPGSDPFSPF